MGQAEDGIRDKLVTGVQTCALPIFRPDLLRTIREVHAGQHTLPAAPATRLAERMRRPELSQRELEVLRLIVKGLANKEIAAELLIRSEERRVGKEGRARRWVYGTSRRRHTR